MFETNISLVWDEINGYFGVGRREVFSNSRVPHVVLARYVFLTLCAKELPESPDGNFSWLKRCQAIERLFNHRFDIRPLHINIYLERLKDSNPRLYDVAVVSVSDISRRLQQKFRRK